MPMAQTVLIRAYHLAPGQVDHIRIVHTGLEGQKEYDLQVSPRGLWLRFVGRRRLELPRSGPLVQFIEGEAPDKPE